jgi:trk system potassium uptake protein TrkA
MRIVFVGAGTLAEKTARALARGGHEIVIVDLDKERLDELARTLDCGLIHGDGTRPSVLKEADVPHCDVLLCLTGDDQTNIIACLVGRSLGTRSVIPRVGEDEFEHVCIELGLDRTVIPSRTIARFLADMIEGQDIMELSAAIKGDARTFVFVAREQDAMTVRDLGLPEHTRVTHLYRDGEFLIADADTRLAKGDEVVLITHHDELPALRERWSA